jgi:hypothetical protein
MWDDEDGELPDGNADGAIEELEEWNEAEEEGEPLPDDDEGPLNMVSPVPPPSSSNTDFCLDRTPTSSSFRRMRERRAKRTRRRTRSESTRKRRTNRSQMLAQGSVSNREKRN